VVWTDGNPFFIEQVILFLQEENLLKRGPQGVMRIEQSQVIPGDVRAVLIARLDRLSMRIKQTVQAASILGQEFELYVLSQVMKSSATLVDDVRTAEQEAIWMTIAEMRYIFKHALMRDTVYDMQLQSQRRVLHKLAAESYEKLFADNLVPHYSEIAYHYEMANIIDGALTYWEKAGLYNKSNYHNRLAMTYFDKIITVLGEILNDLDEGKSPEELSLPPEWSRTWIIEKITEISLFKGQILEVIGEWEGASALYRDLLPYAEILGDILKTAKIYRQLGWIAHLKGDNSKAMEHLQASLSMSLEGGDEAGIGITTGKMGYIHHYLGNYDMAMSCFEKDLELSTKIDNQLGVSIALNNIGNVYRRLNDFGKAMECYERKLDLNTVMRDRKGICVAFGNIGSIHFEQGSYDKAMSCYERCLDISEEIGDKLMISIALFKIGTIHQIKGDAPRAISYYEKRLNISRVLGDKKGIERTLGAMGKIRARQGEIPEALDSFDQAIGICREQGIRNDLAEYLIEKANLVLGQGDWGGAAKLLEEGREIAESINHRETLSQCRLLASRLAEIRNAESARA
jgi:tetratricopeptide (TPR) repeat protein